MTNEARTLTIASGRLSADVSTIGAELQRLDAPGANGRKSALLWNGDPAVWAGRAPILFPIVGMLAGGRYRLGNAIYAMAKHGIARHASFAVVAHDERSVVLRLEADARTRQVYPFDFRLDIAYELHDAALRMIATIANRGTGAMPASFGFHPALRWPLPFGQPRVAHVIRFEHAEPEPIRRIDGNGLLLPDAQPTPVEGRVLKLRDALFTDDALIFDRLTSRRLTYGASQGPQVDVAFDDFPMLGVWTKPAGAGFICIEPWQGVADPVGFEGDLWSKPGMIAIEAGGSRSLTMTIGIADRPDEAV